MKPIEIDHKLNELPKALVQKAVDHIRKTLSQQMIETIQKTIDKDGLHEWAIPYHMSFGMVIRNQLRKDAKIPDQLLPSGNWDDYYISILEVAVGKQYYTMECEENHGQ